MFADASLYRSLASLHRAGVPWPEAMASAGGSHPEARAAEAALAGGASLGDALEAHVDPLDIALIRAGEQSGSLEQALERIAARHEEEVRDASARRTALLYPILLTHIAAFLLPLPDIIQGHFGAGLKWSLLVLAPLYALLWITRRRRVTPGQDDHPGTRAPQAKGVWRNAVEEADARALSALADGFDAGVPLNELMEFARRAGAGGRVAFDLYRGAARIRDGASFGSIWQSVPTQFARKMDTAEKTGELSQTARHAAAEMRFAVETRRTRLAAVLPPIVVIAVGGIIGIRLILFYTGTYGDLLKMGP